MGIWLPYAIQGGEALVFGLAAFLGVIPGVPAHDLNAALALAVAKIIPGSVLGNLVTPTAAPSAPPPAVPPSP